MKAKETFNRRTVQVEKIVTRDKSSNQERQLQSYSEEKMQIFNLDAKNN